MAEGNRLASGYVEVTAKTTAAKKAISELFDDFDKQSDKAGQAVGDALGKGVSDGLKKNAGKSGNSPLEDILTGGGSGSSSAKKAAEKAGQDAGEALGKGIGKGAKGAGKAIGDEITKATKQAGKDAEQVKIEPKITPKVDQKATRKEAQSIPEIIREEANKAAKSKGFDDFGDAMTQAGVQAGKKLGSAIGNTIKDDLGVDLGGAADKVSDVLADTLGGVDFASVLNNTLDRGLKASTGDLAKGLGTRLGRQLGSVVKDQISDALGVNLGDVADRAKDVLGIAQAARGRDFGAALTGVNNLTGGAAQPLSDMHDQLQQSVGGTQEFFNELLTGTAGERYAPLITSAAAPIAGSLALTAPVEDLLKKAPGPIGDFAQRNLPDSDHFNWLKAPFRSAFGDIMHPSRFAKANQYDNNGNFIGDGPSVAPQPNSTDQMYDRVFGSGASASYKPGASTAAEVAVSTPQAVVSAGSVSLAGGISLPSSLTAGLSPRPSAPAVSVVPKSAGAEGNSTASLYGAGSNSMLLGKYSGGTGAAGVDRDGRLYGPGTGTSDSILGVGPDGMPTALVSRGEGLVKDRAMQNGGGLVVAGLNAGLDPVSAAAAADPAGFAQRTQGYIPAGAGASGQAGTSFASGLYQVGADAINGVIDQAAGAASMAAGAMSFGAGGPAAGAAIGIGTQAAKRAVSYGAQMLGIGTDALAEILLPFGVPRWFQTDPTAFMPKIGVQPAATTTGEKAQLSQTPDASNAPKMQPGGPVQPMQLPGAQPIGAPAQMAKPEGVPSAQQPIGPAAGPGSPIAPPPPQSGPMAGQPEQKPKPTDLFGQVLGGLAHGGVVGVFDGGGILPAGGIAINQSKRPEPVFNHEQWGVLQDNLVRHEIGAPDPSVNGGNDYSVNLGDVHVKDVDELMNAIDSRKRLQMMRHAGRP